MSRRPKILPPYLSVIGIDLLETEFFDNEPEHLLTHIFWEALPRAKNTGGVAGKHVERNARNAHRS